MASTSFDIETRFMDGLEPLSGSFYGSQAQRVLGGMVRRGEVEWQHAANMDNWYGLPEQEFPEGTAPRKRTLRSLMGEILSLMSEEDFYGKEEIDARPDFQVKDEWVENFAEIKPDDAWVEFCPFVLTMHEDGWELADGDPICNWCFNTFTEMFPMDVEAATIVERMKKKREDDAMEKPIA